MRAIILLAILAIAPTAFSQVRDTQKSYDVRILTINEDVSSDVDSVLKTVTLDVTLDRPVLNDMGYVTIDFDGKRERLQVGQWASTGSTVPFKPALTSRLFITFDPALTPAFDNQTSIEACLPLSVKYYPKSKNK